MCTLLLRVHCRCGLGRCAELHRAHESESESALHVSVVAVLEIIAPHQAIQRATVQPPRSIGVGRSTRQGQGGQGLGRLRAVHLAAAWWALLQVLGESDGFFGEQKGKEH